jgi:hypothetical protein
MPSIGNVGAVQTQSTKEVDLLSKDIEGLIGGAQKANQAVYEASEYATKLAAIDTDYNTQKGFEEIYNQTVGAKLGRGEQPTSEDYKTMIDWRTNFFKDSLNNVLSDEENNNIIYREMFYKKSKATLDAANTEDSKKYQSLYMQEQFDWYGKQIKNAPVGYNTPETASVMIDHLSKVSGDREFTTKKVWGDIATNQVERWRGYNKDAIRIHVQNNTLDALLEASPFGNFIKYDADGNIVSKKGTYDETSIRFKEEFESSIASAARGIAKDRDRPIDKMAIKAIGDLTVYTSDEARQKAKDNLHIHAMKTYELAQAGNSSAESAMQPFRDAMVEAEVLEQKVSTLNSIYSSFIENPEDTSLLEDPTEIEVNVKSVYGFGDVSQNVVLMPNEIKEYVQIKKSREITSQIESGDVSTNSTTGKQVASLRRSGVNGVATQKADNLVRGIKNGELINSANTIDQLTNMLSMAVSYKDETLITGTEAISGTIIKDVVEYAKQRQEAGESSDNILFGAKALANAAISRNKKFSFQANRELFGMFGMKDEQDASDFISGIDLGEVYPIQGALQVSISNAASTGRVFNSPEQLQDHIAKNLITIDKSYFPIFGTSSAIAAPVADIAQYPKTNFSKNLIDVVKYKFSNLAQVKMTDFTDVVDETSIQFEQPMKDGTVVATMYSGGIPHKAIIRPEEWIDGLTDSDRIKVNTFWEDKGLGKLFNTKEEKQKESFGGFGLVDTLRKITEDKEKKALRQKENEKNEKEIERLEDESKARQSKKMSSLINKAPEMTMQEINDIMRKSFPKDNSGLSLGRMEVSIGDETLPPGYVAVKGQVYKIKRG